MTESVVMRYVNGKYIRESEYPPPKTPQRYFERSWTSTRDLPSGRLRLVVYSPYPSVSWSLSFQETKARTLTQDIRQITKAIENATSTLFEQLQEAERQAEIRRQERMAEEEQRRQEEDRRRTAQSIKDSHDQLEQVIQSWASVVSLEQFFHGIQERSEALPDRERQDILNRLQLAREFVGTQNPLDFFRALKTPIEHYVPLSQRALGTKTDGDEANDQDEDDGDRGC